MDISDPLDGCAFGVNQAVTQSLIQLSRVQFSSTQGNIWANNVR